MIALEHMVAGSTIAIALADDMEECAYMMDELFYSMSNHDLLELAEYIKNQIEQDRRIELIDKFRALITELEK